MQIKHKPYQLLFLTGLLMVLISLFVLNKDNVVDIHFHDTYLVIAHTHIFWLLATLALFAWILYQMANKLLYSKTLTWAHVIITILTLVLFAITLFWGDSFMNPAPRRYYDYTSWSFDNYWTVTKVIGVIILVLLPGQMIFILNLIMGILKRKT